jgi:hypothetical protein
MREIITAEDGDEVVVVTTPLSLQQALVQVELASQTFDSTDAFSLVPQRARELAQALIAAADVIECYQDLGKQCPPLSLSHCSYAAN